jgi:hypothetical protein
VALHITAHCIPPDGTLVIGSLRLAGFAVVVEMTLIADGVGVCSIFRVLDSVTVTWCVASTRVLKLVARCMSQLGVVVVGIGEMASAETYMAHSWTRMKARRMDMVAVVVSAGGLLIWWSDEVVDTYEFSNR